MPERRLHLIVDDDLGPALWVREQTGPGRSRALEDLAALHADAPPPLAAALAGAPERLRHRVRIGSAEQGRRVPALPREGPGLTAFMDAVHELLIERFGAELEEQLAHLVAEGAAVRLSPELIAMPDLVAAAVLDLRARELVAERNLRIRSGERFARGVLRWHAPDGDAPPLLHALVDARARTAFAAHLAARPETPDPHGVLTALAGDGDLPLELPARRRLDRALSAYTDSGRPGVTLGSSENELVVRLFAPPLGSAWPLQTCLREPDGTVHPVADLRAVGDLTPAGAAEASAEVMRLAPTVREAAVDDTGVDWLLTTAEASRFLSLDTPALEEAGVTVLLPREWTAQRTTLRPLEVEEEQQEQPREGSGVGLQAMARFSWRVAVGETELTEEEMEQIRSAQSELVHLRGQWVRLDPTTLRAAERFLESFRSRSTTFPLARAPLPRLSLPGADGTVVPLAPASAPFEVVGQAPWIEMFSMILSPEAADVDFGISAMLAGGADGLARLLPGGAGPAELPPPATLRATLRPYQLQGLNWLWALHDLQLGGILADDMGLGKTMQVLALLCREREEALAAAAEGRQHPIGPTLLVCPMSVVGSWQREAARFAPHLAVHVHHGGDRLRDDSFVAGAEDVDLVITTYSLLARDQNLLAAVPWHRLVLDEAQHVKTPSTQVTQAARRLKARHRLALTGTPVENRLGDLHSLMEVVNPGLLGSAQSFTDRIATPVQEEGDAAALSRLKFITSPFVLRRLKTDRSIISDLPEKIQLQRVVNLTPEQAGLYEAVVEELMAQIGGEPPARRRTLVAGAITRLKQVCNHPAHFLQDGSPLLRDGQSRSGKLELVDDLLATVFEQGQKALVFTQFTTFGHLLVPYWTERFSAYGIEVPFLHGGVPKPARDRMVAEFQEHPDRPGVMLLSLRAGGTGLTLTAANHVVHLDRWWNPAVENQATDRAYRIGQRRDVTVHTLVSAGTIEERIDDVLQDKQALAELTIGPGEEWIGDLDDDRLLELLRLDDAEDR